MFVKLLKALSALLLALLVILLLWLQTRPDMDEVGIATLPGTDSTLRVTWLGISTLLIDDGTTQIMTDAFISRPSVLDVVLKRPIAPDLGAIEAALKDHNLNRLAAIIPVHSHYDHAMDSADVARLTGATVLGSASTANVALSSNLPEAQIVTANTGEAYNFGDFSVTLYPSRHAPLPSNSGISGEVTQPFTLPAPYTAWQEGQSYSVHIRHPAGQLLIQGSAGIVTDAMQGVQADTVFLGTGGLRMQDDDYLEQYLFEYVTRVGARQAVIVHHDDLFGDFGDVEQSKLLLSFDRDFADKIKRKLDDVPIYQMAFGEDYGL